MYNVIISGTMHNLTVIQLAHWYWFHAPCRTQKPRALELSWRWT